MKLRSHIRAMAVTHFCFDCSPNNLLFRDGFSVNRERIQRFGCLGDFYVTPVCRRKPKARHNPVEVRGTHPDHI